MGRSAETHPPAQLRPQTHYFVPKGVVDVYRCLSCGAEWERFLADRDVGAQSGAWKVLNPPQDNS
jgi:hypothetical protein